VKNTKAENIFFIKIFFLVILMNITNSSFSQECATLNLSASEIPVSIDFTFDNISDYVSGKTIAGRVQLKISATDIDAILPPCKWGLKMRVENYTLNLPAPLATDWEDAVYYGANGTPPPIDLLWIRVYNSCKTPINDGFVQFGPLPGETLDEIIIINDILANVAVTPCISDVQVNTAGSYLTFYDQFVFNVDFRIKPNLNLNNKPGKYEIKVFFRLFEQ